MSASNGTPIAIVGIGCRFPGGVDSAAGLWRLAARGECTVGPVPADRWSAARLAELHDPEVAARAGLGCFLDGDVWAWDPQALSVAPNEQRWVDPQFRVLAEVAWEAVEHAGIPMDRIRGSRTGVYVGTYGMDNLFREARPVQDAPNSPYLFGNFTASAAGRVAFALDLRGPVMVISTHCSSGLVAVDTACTALTVGDCDAALAGAVLLMLSPETQFCEAPLLLSRRGACHAFDARADGYVRGEGAGVLVLKRLADACRDGDRVLAVIRGCAVNNDGQATRMTAPSTLVQQQLFRQAVGKAGIDPSEVGLVEAHGPGTAVGDPIEYSSINAVYGQGQGRCALGSIKTNIGHSEPVSGIAGVIKAVECVRRGVIPPNLNFAEWNPSIVRDGHSRLFVPTALTEWPVPDAPRLAAVCSYGVTGTNAHVVLQAATPTRPPRAVGTSRRRQGTRLFALSGSSARSLELAAARLARWVDTGRSTVDLNGVAHTLAMRRWHAEHRLCIAAADHTELSDRARRFAAREETDGVVCGVVSLPPEHAGPVFVFTGQGSQRAGMCQGLLTSEPVFEAVIDEVELLVAAESGFSLREMITHPDRLVGLDRIQPTLFGVQVALAAVWRSWGVEPSAVIGQSLGEVAAAVVAGALSVADGARLICRRSALLATISGGAMASVLLGAEAVADAIGVAGADGVSPAVLTSPNTTVISGDAAQIAGLVADWNGAGVAARMIDVDVASHSAQVDPILEPLRAALADISYVEPTIPLYSTVSADSLRPGPLDADYWVRNQRETVRFRTAVAAALAQGHRLFVECTAHPLAVRPILDTAEHDGVRDVVAVGTLRQGLDDQEAFLGQLGAVHCAGYDSIDWASRYAHGELVDVPGTAWNRVRHGGQDTPYQMVAPHLVGATQHPLLGGHVHDPDMPDRHLWQTPISPARLPWLADHRVAAVPVLPGTGVLDMMLAAARQVFATDQVVATDVAVLRPLILEPEPLVTTQLVRHGDTATVEICSQDSDGVTVHARGGVRASTDQETVARGELAGLDTSGWIDSAPEDLYRHFRQRHDVVHGPAFAGVRYIQVHPDRDDAVAGVCLPDSARVSAWTMPLHPVLGDELVHTVVAVWLAHYATSPGPVVVAGFDEVRVYGPTGHCRQVRVHLHHADDMTATASGQLATAEGMVVAEIRGLRLTNITPPAQRFASRLSQVAWVPQPAGSREPSTGAGSWVVLARQDGGWPAELALAVKSRSAGCRLVVTHGEDPAPGDVPAGCGGVILAVGEDLLAAGPATAARAEVARALAVIQRLAELPTPPPRLWLAWRTDDTKGSELSGLPGLLRVAAYEHPELAASSIAFTDTTPMAAVVDELLDSGLPVTEITLRGTERLVAHIQSGTGQDITIPAAPQTPIRPGAAYLVTGGLGGLGLLTVEWLAQRGAARVVIVGRSAPSPEAAATLDALRRTGTDLTVLTGDIVDIAREAVTAATTGGLALRGVLHTAGVIEDATLANLTPDLLARVWRGKADGAWALHEATRDHELDFFAAYSSVAALLGSPGQGAYAAANAFLDGLIAWRHAQGLVATSIGWGAWSQVGRGQHLAQRGFITITPTDGIDALERIVHAGYHHIAYSPLEVARWIAPYPALRTSTLFAELLAEDAGEAGPAPVREELLAATSDSARHEILETFIIDQLRELLGGTTRHIGPHTSMVVLGLDSLGAVQLQQRLHHGLKIDIKPGVIWVKPTAAALAGWLLAAIGLTGSDDGDEAAPVPPPRSAVRHADTLTDAAP